jgi:hypothetical protein
MTTPIASYSTQPNTTPCEPCRHQARQIIGLPLVKISLAIIDPSQEIEQTQYVAMIDQLPFRRPFMV